MEPGKNLKSELIRLEKKYLQSKTDYYRFVIRNEDKTVLSRLGKIPDNWDNYIQPEGTQLSEFVKARLTDVKKKKSWELKLQSLYIFFITDVENKLLTVFQDGNIDEEELDDTIDSVSNLILEIDDELLNIKYLLLTLAKRSISDLYYMVSAYCKFFLKRNFVYEKDIKFLLDEIIKIFKIYKNTNRYIENLLLINEEISGLFTKSTNEVGWRINESSVKIYFEKSNHASKIIELNKIVKSAYEYKKTLLNYYLFLKFYYNENDGKLFRLNFIYESLKAKYDEKKISEDVFESFRQIREAFIRYKIQFEDIGIVGFGSEKITYFELLHLIYKLGKLIEFYYLRNMKYDALQRFRSDILYYTEKEILSLSG